MTEIYYIDIIANEIAESMPKPKPKLSNWFENKAYKIIQIDNGCKAVWIDLDDDFIKIIYSDPIAYTICYVVKMVRLSDPNFIEKSVKIITEMIES